MSVTADTISIVIAEDHEITRVGLRLTLEQLDGFVVVGEACNGRQAIQEVMDKKPKIVLMDIGLPLMDGIEATRRIKADVPETGIIMLTSHDTDRDIFAALSAGADGYCVKEVSSHRLAIAIRAVVDGAAWLDPAIANRVLRACATGGSQLNSQESEKSDHSPLSQREISVLSLIVAGLSNQEIAERLTLSVETVKTHVRHIMEKLAVHDRTQAAVKALRQGLV